MNVKNKWEIAPVSKIRVILLQVFYWLFFMWLIPTGIIKIFESMHFSLQAIIINTELLNYIIGAIIAAVILMPLLKRERHLEIGKMAYTLIISLSVMFFINILFSLFMSFISGPQASANQNALDIIVNFDKPKFIMMVVIFAPILEELVFRGGIFRIIRGKTNFWIAAFFSSFMFGFMHVFDSLFVGEYMDLIYLFLYGGLGLMLAYAYEYNRSIYACIILHMAYNLMASAAILYS